MNNRKVTLLVLVLVIALALTALTGCGNGNTQEQPTGSPDSQTSEQSPQASEEQEQTSSLPTEDRAGNAIAAVSYTHLGMGFTVMQTFMDEVQVTSAVGEGTSVLMAKRIKSKEQE